MTSTTTLHHPRANTHAVPHKPQPGRPNHARCAIHLAADGPQTRPPPRLPFKVPRHRGSYTGSLKHPRTTRYVDEQAGTRYGQHAPRPRRRASTAAMANVDFGRYKRIVQYFWDPAPTNAASKQPIWCLGKEYRPSEKAITPKPDIPSPPESNPAEEASPERPATPPESIASSFDESVAYEESRNMDEDGGWPPSFLDDFEARVWLSYRSGFPLIPRSQDPSALSSMSLSVRLRSQLVDSAGFTSDTGWGCMIRSGQSLLANALVMLRLGRGL
jgi:hypothetical protein